MLNGFSHRKKEVHTFIRSLGWMGADVTREKALAAFKASVRVLSLIHI